MNAPPDTPWNKNNHSIWLASTITLHRNMARHVFPAKMESLKQLQLFGVLSSTLAGVKQLQEPTVLAGKDASAADKELLFEHFLVQGGLQEAAHQGEGLAFDKGGQFFALLNIRDHVQLQWVDVEQDLEKAYAALSEIESELGKSFEWAWTPRFGFLTTDPRHSGTGLSVRLFLHLPALARTGALAEQLKGQEEVIESKSLQGDEDHFVGDVIVLTNRYSIGVSEEEILRAMRLAAGRLQTAEKNVRKEAQSNESLKDQASRAYGLLVHSLQLELAEALDAVSLCKLAVDEGWMKGVDHQVLNQLMFALQRGHLQKHKPDAADQIAKVRSEIVRDALKTATF